MRLTAPGLFAVVLHVLAVARLSRLVTHDRISRPFRLRVIRWAYGRHEDLTTEGWAELAADPWRWDDQASGDGEAEAPALAWLVRCAWCMTIWIAVVWTVLWRFWPAGWWWGSVALVASLGAVWVLARIEPTQSSKS